MKLDEEELFIMEWQTRSETEKGICVLNLKNEVKTLKEILLNYLVNGVDTLHPDHYLFLKGD